ncbi:MAG: penicillin-binding transpeptidase domain-containing protein [bacterium]
MERIKDWKSYQKTLNKRKSKKNKSASFIKYAAILIFLILFFYGSFRLYFYGKSIFIAMNKKVQGTGIRPILFIKDKLDGKQPIGFDITEIKSVKSLKKYFKYNPPVFKTILNGRYIQKIGGYTVVYTVDPAVQKEVNKIFRKYAVPFGVLAAVNPDTGAVLGFASYSNDKRENSEISPLISYPPGSLVKIITASAAIESKGFYPGLEICFNGGLYKTDETYWKQNIGIGSNKISFKQAFAKSCDVAFGKVAGYYVGRRLLTHYFDKFYFNKKIPFILNIDQSKAYVPRKFFQLELTGAGFKNVKVTPLQAALIAGSVINGGKIVKPYIIKEIISAAGKVVYVHKGHEVLNNPITAKTANILKQMMIATVTQGAAHKDFYNVNNKYILPGVTSGGKTGTISGDNPAGLYQWFAGFGEMNGKKIALSSLVIENPVWNIEGGGVAEKALFAYFF